MLYAIAILMLLAVIPISEYMAGGIQNSSNNYLLVLDVYKRQSGYSSAYDSFFMGAHLQQIQLFGIIPEAMERRELQSRTPYHSSFH